MLSLNCNNCGAPLEVQEGTRFVTCRSCSSRLEVQRSGDAAFTRKLEAIEQRTEDLARDVNDLKVDNEVERIDREWQMERDRMLLRGDGGTAGEPSVATGVITMIGGVAIGIGWFYFTSSMGPQGGYFPWFGILVALVAVGGGLWHLSKAWEFQSREREYRARRARALQNRRDPRGGP